MFKVVKNRWKHGRFDNLGKNFIETGNKEGWKEVDGMEKEKKRRWNEKLLGRGPGSDP